MDKEIIYKAFDAKLEQKSEGEDGKMHIVFYAAAFDNVDSWGDIIVKGAFDAFLASDARKRCKLCFQHDAHEVIGVITDMKADEYGLLCEADILPTTTGKDVQMLLKEGAINEFSIGYWADSYHYEKRGADQDEVRILEAVTLVEISPVTRAANPKAILLDAKSDEFIGGLKSMTDDQLEDMRNAIEHEYWSRFVNYL